VCASRLFLSRLASRLFPEPCPSTCRACSQISLLFWISRLRMSRQKRAPVLIFFLILRCNVFFLSCPYSPKTVSFVTPVLGVQSNAKQFKYADEKWVRKKMTVMGARTLMELRGISCINLEEVTLPKKEIISSKSFGKSIETLDGLKEAIATYTSTAAYKLRSQNSLANSI